MNELFQAINRLRDDIENLKKSVDKINRPYPKIPNGPWLDTQDVLFTLNISKRTLQTMRDQGQIAYSRIRNKFFYKGSDVEEMLRSTYRKATNPLRHG